MATVSRPALITRIWPKGRPAEAPVTGRNVAALTTPPPQPFFNDSPNPVLRPRFREAVTVYPNILATVLQTTVVASVNTLRLPLMTRIVRPPRGADLGDIGWESRNTTLLVAVAAGNPFSQGDWPNPQQKRATLEIRNCLNMGLAPLPTFQPFTEFPNPQLPRRAIELRTHTQNLLQTTLQPPNPPVVNLDFPNPTTQRFRIENRGQTLGLQQTTLIPGTPLRPFDWPNPLRPTHPIVLRTVALGLNQTTLKPPDPGIVALDWPNPVRKRYPQAVYDQHPWRPPYDMPPWQIVPPAAGTWTATTPASGSWTKVSPTASNLWTKVSP